MLRALTSFHANGRFIEAGDEVGPKDPIVKGRESLFVSDSSSGVEQATAAPGEKRATRTRASKKA